MTSQSYIPLSKRSRAGQIIARFKYAEKMILRKSNELPLTLSEQVHLRRVVVDSMDDKEVSNDWEGEFDPLWEAFCRWWWDMYAVDFVDEHQEHSDDMLWYLRARTHLF